MATVSAQFRSITDEYYRTWFRFHPEAAVDVGVWGYEHLLTPFLPDDLGPLVCLNDELLVSLDELDLNALSPDDRTDWELMRGAALLENEYLLDLAPRFPDPGRLLPINAIYQLTIRMVPDPAASLGARLAAIPAYLRQATEYLRPQRQRVPSLWAQSALAAARDGGPYLHALGGDLPHERRAPGFDQLVRAAEEALKRFADFLQHEVCPAAGGNIACGAARFERLLRYRHFLDVTPEQLRTFGESLCDSVQSELDAACVALTGRNDLASALSMIRQRQPVAEELLAVYRREMQAAYEFVQAHGLVSIPTPRELAIVETPTFLRNQIPFAAYMEPAAHDPVQRGYYYVTPPADAEQMGEHDLVGIRHTCVHEAWPGHHLQFVRAHVDEASRSLPRLLNASATLYEGWALYCEQLMHEQGFLSGSKHRVILLRDRLWRALRVVIDVDIHTGGRSVQDAVDLLVARLGFSRAQASAELTWYSRSPTVPLSYAAGWALIDGLRAAEGATDSPDALRVFHDRLLSMGSVGLPRVIAQAFGAGRWRELRARLGAAETAI